MLRHEQRNWGLVSYRRDILTSVWSLLFNFQSLVGILNNRLSSHLFSLWNSGKVKIQVCYFKCIQFHNKKVLITFCLIFTETQNFQWQLLSLTQIRPTLHSQSTWARRKILAKKKKKKSVIWKLEMIRIRDDNAACILWKCLWFSIVWVWLAACFAPEYLVSPDYSSCCVGHPSTGGMNLIQQTAHIS